MEWYFILLACIIAFVIYIVVITVIDRRDTARSTEKIQYTVESYRTAMLNYLKNLMLDYIKNNPSSGDTTVPIFEMTKQIINNLSYEDIYNELIKDNMPYERSVLNSVSNIALNAIEPKDGAEYLASGKDPARKLYEYINEVLLNKGYIDKNRFDENYNLAVRRSIIPPLGQWLDEL